MVCIYAAASQLMEATASKQSLWKSKSPLFGHWGSRQAISSHFTRSLTHFDLIDLFWGQGRSTHWIRNYTLQNLRCFLPFIFCPVPWLWKRWEWPLQHSLWWHLPSPLQGRLCPSVRDFTIQASVKFGPGNGFLQRKTLRVSLLSWLRDENCCILVTLWGKNTL